VVSTTFHTLLNPKGRGCWYPMNVKLGEPHIRSGRCRRTSLLTLRRIQPRSIGSRARSMITIPTEASRSVEKIRLTEFFTSTFHKSTPDGEVRYASIYRTASFKCITQSLQTTRLREPMDTRVQQHPMLSP